MILAGIFINAGIVHAQELGSIRGVVYDRDFEAPLAEAQVTIAETGQEATTTSEGNYVLPEVSPGAYTLVFSKEGFARQVKSDVVVSPGQLSEADAWLTGDFTEMDEFIVQDLQLEAGSEAALLELRIESPSLMDSISADLMSQAGAGDVASALKLVSGATVSQGKFAVIRGLPDRYVSSQMNGVRLPSADAETRAVALDQFPSDVIESVQVSKTFTPDQQGDASGGAVNIVLKGVPDENVLKFGAKVGFNSQVAGRDDFLTYRGGGVNALGLDSLRGTIPVESIDPGTGTRTLSDDRAAGVSRGEAPWEYGFDLTAGIRHESDTGVAVGGLANLYYERGASFHDNGIEDDLVIRDGALVPDHDGEEVDDVGLTSLLDVTQGSEEVQWGGLISLGLEMDNHEFTMVFMRTHLAEDQAVLAEDTRGKEFFFPGHDPEDPSTPGFGSDVVRAPYNRLETLEYTERSTQTLQFHGKHTLTFIPEWTLAEFFTLKAPEFDWRVSQNSAELDEPDKRTFETFWLPNNPQFNIPAHHSLLLGSGSSGNFERAWRNISEESDQYAINVKFPFQHWTEQEGYIKAGFFSDNVIRKFRQESFGNDGIGNVRYEAPFDELLSEVYSSLPISDSRPVSDQVKNDVDYDGFQNITAWYVMADIPVTSFLKFIGGVRFETMEMSVTNMPEESAIVFGSNFSEGTFFFDGTGQRIIDSGTGLPIGDSEFEQSDVLPAASIVVTPFEELTLRAAYTETVARQTFRELAPVVQTEFAGGDVFVGNPELEMAAVTNYDLRADYRPTEGSLFSVSWFLKKLENPIEYVQDTDRVIGRFTTPTNFPKGELSGWEFEARQDFGAFWDALAGFSIGANATFIDSEVTVPANVTSEGDTRRMLNAPEHLFNVNLRYSLEETGTDIGLFYTVRGDTLIAGPGSGSNGFIPPVFEAGHETLNLTLSQKLGEHFKLKFSAKNLTNPEIQEVYRSETRGLEGVKSSYTKGIDFSLSISANFTF